MTTLQVPFDPSNQFAGSLAYNQTNQAFNNLLNPSLSDLEWQSPVPTIQATPRVGPNNAAANLNRNTLNAYRQAQNNPRTGIWGVWDSVTGANSKKYMPTYGLEGDDLAYAKANNEEVAALQKQSKSGLEAAGAVAQGISSLGQLYTAYRGVKLSEKTLKSEREAFRKNFDASAKQYNTRLEQQQVNSMRMAGTYSETALKEYMDKHSIKG